jgi:hypothetical protein
VRATTCGPRAARSRLAARMRAATCECSSWRTRRIGVSVCSHPFCLLPAPPPPAPPPPAPVCSPSPPRSAFRAADAAGAVAAARGNIKQGAAYAEKPQSTVRTWMGKLQDQQVPPDRHPLEDKRTWRQGGYPTLLSVEQEQRLAALARAAADGGRGWTDTRLRLEAKERFGLVKEPSKAWPMDFKSRNHLSDYRPRKVHAEPAPVVPAYAQSQQHLADCAATRARRYHMLNVDEARLCFHDGTGEWCIVRADERARRLFAPGAWREAMTLLLCLSHTGETFAALVAAGKRISFLVQGDPNDANKITTITIPGKKSYIVRPTLLANALARLAWHSTLPPPPRRLPLPSPPSLPCFHRAVKTSRPS